MFRIGEQPVPGYKLVSFLGKGSYGEVWKATAPGGFDCALKFINLDSNSGLKEFRAINMMKRVRHANLVPISAVWLKDPDGNILGDTGSDSTNIRMGGTKQLIIAMGLGDKTLGDRLEDCRAQGSGIPIKELLEYMRDAAKGIDYLNKKRHDLGDGPTAIIHCDIKPANLLLVGGSVQVCDYGVAKAVSRDMRKTHAGGTVAYAPAELLNGEPSAQTDQYSLAITYFELRTGKLPFDENRAMFANITGNLDFSELPEDEQEVLKRATNMQPAKRYPSCQDMVDELLVASGISIAFGPSGVIPQNALNRRTDSHPNVLVQPPPPPPVRLTDRLQGGVEIVPDHRLIKVIGQGGFGQVWEAENGGMPCALKVIRDLRGRGRNELEIFKKIRNLSHPHLIQFRGYWLLAADGTRVQPDDVGKPGVPDPTAVVISTNLAEMNLLHRLRDYQQRGMVGIPPDELIEYIKQAADALDYLNQKHDIQHRDIKPENLLLSGGRLLVSDFGLAKLVDVDGRAAVSSSSGMTLDYAAPEVLDQKTVFPQTDQYSLAVTYYMLRTGRLPFRGNMSVSDAIKARMSGQLDLSGVSKDEQDVLRMALNPQPSLRFDSCEHFAKKLSRAVTLKGHAPPPNERQKSMTEVLGDPEDSFDIPLPAGQPTLPPSSGTYRGSTSYPAAAHAQVVAPLPKPLPRETDPTPHTPTARKSDTDVPLTPVAPPPPPAKTSRSTDKLRGTEPDWKHGARGTAPQQKSSGTSTFITDDDLTKVIGKRKPRAVVGCVVVLCLGIALAAGGTGAYVSGVLDPLLNGQGSGGGDAPKDPGALAEEIRGLVAKKDYTRARGALPGLKDADPTKAAELEDFIANAEKADKEAAKLEKDAKVAKLEEDFKAVVSDPEKRDEANKLLADIRLLNPEKAADLAVLMSKPVVELTPEQKGERLLKEIQAAIATNDKTKADEKLEELKKLKVLDTQTTEIASAVKKAFAPAVVPTPMTAKIDGRVQQARTLFKEGKKEKVAEGIDLLTELLSTKSNPNEPTKKEAQPLLDAWNSAQTAVENYVPGGDKPVAEYLTAFRPKANTAILAEDQQSLQAYARTSLADAIKRAVPKLGDKSDWAKLAEACEEALKVPSTNANRVWVEACRVECWAELGLASRTARAEKVPAELKAADADGYAGYALALFEWANDGLQADKLPKAADKLAAVKVAATATMTPYRAGRVGRTLFDAAESFRSETDLNQPFPKMVASRVQVWLGVAQEVAARLGKDAAVRPERVAYLRLLAAWSNQSGEAMLAPLADRVAVPDVLNGLELTIPEQARVWLIHATSRPAGTEGAAAALNSFGEIISLMRLGTKVPRSFVAAHVFPPLLARLAARELKPGSPDAAKAAPVIARGARQVFRYRAEWAAVSELKPAPAEIAAKMFDAAAEMSARADDLAWAGICRSELPDVPISSLVSASAKARSIERDDPAVALLVGVISGLRGKAAPDLRDRVAASVEADIAYRESLKRYRASPAKYAEDDLVYAYKVAATNAILLANLDYRDRDLQATLITDAVDWSRQLLVIAGDQLDVLDTRGCALEDRAWILRPPTRFAAKVGEYDLADAEFFKAIGNAAARGEAYMHRGRNLFKKLEDEYNADKLKPGTFPDRIREVDSVLNAGLNHPSTASRPLFAAECRYWLGKAQLLRHTASRGGNDAKAAYQEAVRLLTDALPGFDPKSSSDWYELILLELANAHFAETARLADINPAEAEKTLAKVAAVRDRKEPLALSPVYQAYLTLRVVDLRKRNKFDPAPEEKQAGGRTAFLRATADGLAGDCLTQHRWAQIHVLVQRAATFWDDSDSSNKDYDKYLDGLRAAAQVAEKNPLATPTYRATPFMWLGEALHQRGEYFTETDKKQRDQYWQEAQPLLEKAVAIQPQDSRSWVLRWRLGDVMIAAAKKKESPLDKGLAYAVIYNHLREAQLLLMRLDWKVLAIDEKMMKLLKENDAFSVVFKMISPGLDAALKEKCSPLEQTILEVARLELDSATGALAAPRDADRPAIRKLVEKLLAELQDVKSSELTICGFEMIRRLAPDLIGRREATPMPVGP